MSTNNFKIAACSLLLSQTILYRVVSHGQINAHQHLFQVHKTSSANRRALIQSPCFSMWPTSTEISRQSQSNHKTSSYLQLLLAIQPDDVLFSHLLIVQSLMRLQSSRLYLRTTRKLISLVALCHRSSIQGTVARSRCTSQASLNAARQRQSHRWRLQLPRLSCLRPKLNG